MTSLTELSIGKNKLTDVEDDALSSLTNLVTLDLHLNAFTMFSQVPNSPKLDQILLGYNQLTDIQNLDRAPSVTVLDLSNNKLDTLPDSVCQLYNLKTL
jgi:Leucine-rich repeat (LRR) protein